MQRLGVAFALLTIVLPAAMAHNPVEAQELELLAIEDEGTDLIDGYGGYDIVAVFIGGAHHRELGQGVAGDGFYLRIELYGKPDGPNAVLPNAIHVRFAGGNGTVERTITTPDGVSFASDFDHLELEAEDVEVHVRRAFLLWSSVGLAPGSPIKDLVVETTYGDDPRDVAPGGIYVPGSGGAATYPDPTQIDGAGRLIEAPVPPAADAYFGAVTASARGNAYRVEVQSGLHNGAQHILAAPPAGGTAWNVSITSPAAEVAANGTYVLEFTAAAGPGASDLAIDLLSDVGGRLRIAVAPDGVLAVRGLETRPAAEPVPAPIAGPLGLAALAVALACKRLRRTG